MVVSHGEVPGRRGRIAPPPGDTDHYFTAQAEGDSGDGRVPLSATGVDELKVRYYG